MKKITDNEILRKGKEIIQSETKALSLTAKKLDKNFIKAVNTIFESKGKVVVFGIGKSGLIGRKIAATLSSTGTESFFVHPVEGLHGDLGVLRDGDTILALSFSGQTEEISKVITLLKKRKLNIISITGNSRSSLAMMSNIHLKVWIDKEACPYNLAPTSSTTAMLAMGDALAISLMKLKNFEATDFAQIHPGGNLGKFLTLEVKDIMKTIKPTILQDKKVADALKIMTKSKSGAVMVVGKNGKIVGYFTDGDLRRGLLKTPNITDKKISTVMTKNPITFTKDIKAVEAAKIIFSKKIDNAPVVDKNNKPIGLVDEKDLLEFIPKSKK
ncbi:MAG: KpsF/GutQ family sugar-phosphate isomerase [Elusimicrobiaceae bacterium]|jgi:arabinose-5-phosphate isomerase|nr:KpsF/GutQ family sugar-phosphate isomerase [Elusimicrobiaceae bacterium]MBT4008501.1 KpsF/GutQ family sugar-phosphate isomerase [Elusimicrobiaceae bacterium]MBT4403389.1 KpsF/GutQ family sugar-phosphate isomerase [Elusimicrobiaceae bacterium]MBT4440230.1 KpsF/GutQ family sugar-phosphate isomerase [Elusimicrobiaceae bacterium]MBT5987654.1 KpsF/GutQ family sugar-phosphate isomerase [Elusimicrobiaceae bacterium]